MKKPTLKGARIISGVICFILMVILGLFCFLGESVVAIVSNSVYEPIYKGSKTSPHVALMFNVYENADVVNGIIDLLNKRSLKATFFIGGCFADDNTQTIKRIIAEGHTLANHGFFHKDHKKLSEAENRMEIKTTHDLIFAMCGYKMNLFAPPSGSYSKTTLIVAQKLGYKTIMWSKDTIDWRDSDVDLIIKRATDVEYGDLILMHPKPHTLRALPKILDFYKLNGIIPVTVDEIIKDLS